MSPKIVFFGTSDFAVPGLKSLLNFGYQIVAVVTQPEKPVGRARIVTPSPIKKVASQHHIQVFEPHNLKKDEEFFNKFKHLNPDLCVVASYGKIIPRRYLEMPRYGFINIHPSLLPKYRGPSPIQTAIMNSEPAPILSADRYSESGRDWYGAGEETGVTIMLMDDQIDHGPILSSKTYYLLPTTYYPQAEEELAKLGAELMIEVLPQYISGEIQPREQDHSRATFTKIVNRQDGRINWERPAEEIYNQIRALNPEPGPWTIWDGKVLNIKVAEPSNIACTGKKPGTVEKIGTGEVAVATKKCYLILRQIQLEGKRETDVRSFVNGYRDFIGSELK